MHLSICNFSQPTLLNYPALPLYLLARFLKFECLYPTPELAWVLTVNIQYTSEYSVDDSPITFPLACSPGSRQEYAVLCTL